VSLTAFAATYHCCSSSRYLFDLFSEPIPVLAEEGTATRDRGRLRVAYHRRVPESKGGDEQIPKVTLPEEVDLDGPFVGGTVHLGSTSEPRTYTTYEAPANLVGTTLSTASTAIVGRNDPRPETPAEELASIFGFVSAVGVGGWAGELIGHRPGAGAGAAIAGAAAYSVIRYPPVRRAAFGMFGREQKRED
jgi:hypothetical protein